MTHPQPSQNEKLRVVLADDHELVRDGLRWIIDNQNDMEVVGEANNGADAVRLVADLRPAILIVDVSMPGMTGVEVTEVVRAASPETQVIGVTRHRDSQFVTAMLAAGAAGYVLKQSSSAELLQAVRTVAAGTRFIDRTLPQPGATDALNGDAALSRSQGTRRPLDDLEQAILELLASAHSESDIADRLSIRPEDVDAVKVRAMRKAGLRSRVEVVDYVRGRQYGRGPSEPE